MGYTCIISQRKLNSEGSTIIMCYYKQAFEHIEEYYTEIETDVDDVKVVSSMICVLRSTETKQYFIFSNS